MNKMSFSFLKFVSPHLLFAVSALLPLLLVFVASYYFAFRPCPLCKIQQYLFVIILLLGLVTTVWLKQHRKVMTFILTALYIINAGTALYQVAVEHHWIKAPALCKNKKLTGVSIDEMREQLLNTETVRCDKIQWSLFGLSMAGYNALYSLLWSIIGFYFLRYGYKRK